MVQYQDMSLVYDQLTQDQPYDSWFNIVKHYSDPYGNIILDIGCGTGSLTHLLISLGDVTGMDLSVDMLSIARQKSNQVTWIKGDMTQFELIQKFNIITIFCDSLNYLSTDKDVKKRLSKLYFIIYLTMVYLFLMCTLHIK